MSLSSTYILFLEQEPQNQRQDDLTGDAICRGCGFQGRSLLQHLNKTTLGCKTFYNMEEWQEARGQKKRAQEKKWKRDNKEWEKEYKQDYYQRNEANIRDQQRRSYQEHRNKRRASKKMYYQRQKEINFANEDEKKRHEKFQLDLRDCFSHICVCCHKIMSSSGVRPVPGNIQGLKQRLEMVAPGLFAKCIKEKLPPGAVINKSIYLCTTCNKWLFQKKKVPKHSVLNGLDCEDMVPLTDLESVLVSKNILFLKIVHLPKSRWHAVQDKTVNVPILDDDILKTLNTVQAFPRKSDESGLIPVKLKRKLEFKNKHLEAYVRPEALYDALKIFKEKGHPYYQDIEVRDLASDNLQDAQDSSNSEATTSSSEEEHEWHPAHQHQHDFGGETILTENFPESSVAINSSDKVKNVKRKDDSTSSLQLAPGEGKVPTSLMRDDDWDIKAFPHLHSSGKFGLNHPRENKLTPQEYFKQRILNVDKRWARNKTYLFAALYYVERHHLERQINVSYRRGKLSKGSMVNMEDIFSVFDNVTGTPRFWQQKRFEVIAKLEQLGAFQFFYTLSCADKRWPETFVSILRQKGLIISYRPSKEKVTSTYSFQPDEIWVKTGEDQPEQRLEEYLATQNEHELIRKNVLSLTMAFDKRVHAFMRRIVKAKSSPMNVEHHHYRVEFQLRGAGHIHGVLWCDLTELEKAFPGLQSAMTKLRVSARLNEEDKTTLEKFVDTFISCSLDDEDLVDIVESVQKHSHTHTCYKKGPSCRFGFPKFPSERTIIAQPMDKNDFHSERAYNEEKKRHKEVLSKVKEVLQTLTGEEVASMSLDDVLKKSGVTASNYYRALEVSQTGACVILKRRVCEVYINNYNPEWLKSWDGNMDIQVCLDFFAVTTYITDYYTKTESAMASELKAAFKRSAGMERKEQMKYLVETFLRTRQMGESEAIYRLLPQLHLSDSDIKCVYVATGFPWNRSTFLVKQSKDKLVENEDEDESLRPREDTIQLPGREGNFKAAVSVHEKYAARPKELEHICLAQFAISYDMQRGRKNQDDTADKEENVDPSSMIKQAKIVSWCPEYETPLPSTLNLANRLGMMKLRGQRAVLRQHKFRQDLDPHEYFYSQLVLYRPWRSEEEELCAQDLEGCIRLFNEMEEGSDEVQSSRQTKIEKTKGKLFPLQNDVEEARAMMEEVSDSRTMHIGDVLDAENQKDNEDQMAEGMEETEEHAARNPEHLAEEDGSLKGHYEKTVFRKIDISNLDEMRNLARQLDPDQRYAFDILIKYVKQLRASTRSGFPKPKPPLLKIHGGAGCGKSTLIKVIAQFVEHFMTVFSDKDPERPAVVKVAPTGKAGHNIMGMTYHSAFSIPWGNQSFSLSDKTRDTKRSQLSELKLVILDEMSMLKSDALYQIHLRLQEITQSQNAFGGVAVILSGDLMQIPPVSARWIFQEPAEEAYQISHAIEPLWDQFSPIELRHNHRQGNDRVYGDLLNRVRRGKHTAEDIEVLQSKVTDVLPEGALHLYGTNVLVKSHNEIELSKLPGETEIINAIHVNRKRKGWKPQLDDWGNVKNTPFKDVLHLKVGSRVMITYNIDGSDGLINGTMGTVVGFAKERGRVVKVLVECDNKQDGEKTRKKHEAILKRLKLPNATPIGRHCFEYSLGKTEKHHAGAKAEVIQFPLTTAWAITIHKCQGENIRSPTPLVADIASVHKKGHGMAYVALGRIQNIDQLFLKSFKPEKIMISEEAEAEAQKIEHGAVNIESNQDHWNKDWRAPNSYIRKIASLNIR